MSCFGIPALKTGRNFFVEQNFRHLAENCHCRPTKKCSIRFFFKHYCANEIRDRQKNKLTRESHFFVFRRLQKTTLHVFHEQLFCKQHQAGFEIISIRYQKGLKGIKKHRKRKTCWVKSIVATKFISCEEK